MSDVWPGKLAIIGTGLLGSSVGLAAHAAGVPVVTGFDADGREAGHALDIGALTELADSV